MTTWQNTPLSFSVAPAGPATVLTLSGAADAAEMSTLRSQFDSLMSETVPKIILDLTGLIFIGSSGLGLLVEELHRARAGNGDLRLVNANARICEILETTRLNDLLPMYATIGDAVAAPWGNVST